MTSSNEFEKSDPTQVKQIDLDELLPSDAPPSIPPQVDTEAGSSEEGANIYLAHCLVFATVLIAVTGLLLYLAVVVSTVVVRAVTKERTSILQIWDFQWPTQLREFVTEFGDVRGINFSVLEHVPVPSPSIKIEPLATSAGQESTLYGSDYLWVNPYGLGNSIFLWTKNNQLQWNAFVIWIVEGCREFCLRWKGAGSKHETFGRSHAAIFHRDSKLKLIDPSFILWVYHYHRIEMLRKVYEGPLAFVQCVPANVSASFGSLRSFLGGTVHKSRKDCIDNQKDQSYTLQSKGPPIYGIALYIGGYLAMWRGWRWRIRDDNCWRDWWIGFVVMLIGFSTSVYGGMLVFAGIF